MNRVGRKNITEVLLLLCDGRTERERFERELDRMDMEQFLHLYGKLRPKLRARQEQVDRKRRQQKRRQQLLEEWQKQEELHAAWSRRWRLPKIAIPIKERYVRWSEEALAIFSAAARIVR